VSPGPMLEAREGWILGLGLLLPRDTCRRRVSLTTTATTCSLASHALVPQDHWCIWVVNCVGLLNYKVRAGRVAGPLLTQGRC
jgi:hypothetical protein